MLKSVKRRRRVLRRGAATERLEQLTGTALQPVSAMAARAIQAVLPGIGRGADALSPVIDSSVRRGFSDGDALPAPQTEPTSPAEAP